MKHSFSTNHLLILCLLLALFIAPRQAYSQAYIPETIAPHPRLFLKAGEEERIKQILPENRHLNRWHQAIISESDRLLTEPTLTRTVTGRRLLAVSREALGRIFYLSYAYRTTGRDVYKNRAIQEMMAVAAFPDWNPSHFLDVAEMTAALAIGYDWLYPALNSRQKDIVRQAIIQKGLRDSDRHFDFDKSHNNWSQVCNGGLTLGALAVYEDDTTLAKQVIRRAIETIALPLQAYAPDGAYPEGGGYWSYGTGFNVLLNAALESALGTDFGLSGNAGFQASARFVQYLSSASGKMFNYSDNGEEIQADNPALYWFAAKYRDPSLLWLALSSAESHNFRHPDRLLPLTLIYGSQVDFSQITPPSEKIWAGRGTNPVVLIRTGWKERDDLYVGMKGGSPAISHGHMDGGTFVFDALGERWAMDLGAQDYHAIEQAGIDLWNSQQNSRRWDIFRYANHEHNTLTINNRHQSVAGNAPITEVFRSNKRLGGRIDLTSLYAGDVSKAVRDIELINEQYLQITDNITAADRAAQIVWTLVTPAAVSQTGRNEMLLTQNGKELVLSVQSPRQFELTSHPATPESGRYGDPNPGVTLIRLSCTAGAKSRVNIRVQLKPVQKEVQVYPVVNWNKVAGRLTADHWGVNDNGPGMSSVNTQMEHFFDRVQPGIIRRHNSGFLNHWVDNDARQWNVDVINSELANAKATYRHSRVMLCLDTSPAFIGRLPLTEAQEDSIAVFFARLPVIVDSLGYRVEMYEFFNEKEGPYGALGGNGGNGANEVNPAYWRVLNKIALAMKAAAPAIKVGGPATSYPYENVYKGFIDNCGHNMDFISFHLYARGSIPETNADAELFFRTDRHSAVDVAALVNYAKAKGLERPETFLNEFNVQWEWRKYEPRHHNHVGAAWMACMIKTVALHGVTGLNIWNVQDGTYGLNYNTAPANLYLMSEKHLRGQIVESSDPQDKIEMLPVIAPDGKRSLLLINRTGEKVTVMKARSLLGVKQSTIRGMRLDGNTRLNVNGTEYVTETMPAVPGNIVLNPYGMVLLTDR